MPTPAHANITLSAAPLFTAFAAAQGGEPGDDISTRDVEFAGDLYTGQEANGLYVDLATLTIERAELPVLLQHDPARVIGIQTVSNDGQKLTTKGRLFTNRMKSCNGCAASGCNAAHSRSTMYKPRLSIRRPLGPTLSRASRRFLAGRGPGLLGFLAGGAGFFSRGLCL